VCQDTGNREALPGVDGAVDEVGDFAWGSGTIWRLGVQADFR
jgi:hypothetical protein